MLPLHERFSSAFRRVVHRGPWRSDPVDRVSEAPALTDLPEPEGTLGLIQRQEALRRRGRPSFSVVVVEVAPPPAGPHLVLRLMQAFRQRARLGDEMGWLAVDRLAMILPLTARDGARRFVGELFGRLGDGCSTPPFEIFTE